jgi:hypothetical protein
MESIKRVKRGVVPEKYMGGDDLPLSRLVPRERVEIKGGARDLSVRPIVSAQVSPGVP